VVHPAFLLPVFVLFSGVVHLSVLQVVEEWSWHGGPFADASFRWPAYIALSSTLFCLSAAAVFLFWRKSHFARAAIGVALALSVLHGFFMVLIDDGDGDFLQGGEFAVKVSLGALVLFFLSRPKAGGRMVLLAYVALWLPFLGMFTIPHPFGDGWESLQAVWSSALGLLLLLGFPRKGSLPIRNARLRRGLLAVSTAYLYLVLMYGLGQFLQIPDFLEEALGAAVGPFEAVLMVFFIGFPLLFLLYRVFDRFFGARNLSEKVES